MLERRPLFGLLIGLTVCVSIWRISLQEASMVATEVNYINQYQPQTGHRQEISSRSLAKSSGEEIPWRSNARNGNTNRNSRNLNDIYSNFNLSLVSLPSSVINYDMLPKDDLSSLIDLHDFEFIMNQKPCASSLSASDAAAPSGHSSSADSFSQSGSESRSPPLVLILVHSAPANHKKRHLIRQTWGSLMDQSTRLIFLLGAVIEDEDQAALEHENNLFADMVQGNFIDSYRNMTYKHVMALKWFTYYCPDAKFILKVDDDIFVNTPFLLTYLNSSADRQNLLFCQKLLGSRVKRSYRSKWRVSIREYPGRYYPTYCPGYAIIYSGDVAFRLYVEAQRTPYFWIDDVHLTGTLSQQANITITSFESLLLRQYESEQIVAGKTEINNYVFLFTSPSVQENYTRSLWDLLRAPR